MKHGKKYVDSAKLIDRNNLYDVAEALDLTVKTGKAKFDETVEVHVKLGVDSRHADQQVRGAVVLPHGTGKKVRVLVFAKADKAQAATDAGADFVGTTMRGYTPETEGCDDIDFDFVHTLATQCPAKVIAEGHIHYPEQAVKALEAGAFALGVGGAITRPAEITARFTGAIHAMNK